MKRRGSDTKFIARVLAIGNECDLALLTVDDPSFWHGLAPIALAPLPELQDSVIVVGYPIGGETMSISSGVVSRIEVTQYSHGSMQLLGIQIDAAINPGNSGGPAFNDDGNCVGVAFQSLSGEDAENIGYIIPTPVISHFLKDFDTNGRYTGFPEVGCEWQNLENPHLRRQLRLPAEAKGILVKRVKPTSCTASHLVKGDVILKFDGVEIANDGTVPFRTCERISFTYLVTSKVFFSQNH